MPTGLLAVADDILSAALKASAKSAGVVIDDAAVTPQYVRGISPARELPVVWRIARGSLLNKSLIIPVALLLTAFAPWTLPILLIIGGTYLCFEGAEKVTEWFGHHHAEDDDDVRDENKLVAGAIRTDLILSTEIMLIGLSNLPDELGFWMRLGALVVIALAMTAFVYGSVALLVKLDDIGLHLATGERRKLRHLGVRIVRSMPAVFRLIGVIGTVAMLWVGGHLVIANVAEIGWHLPEELLHALEAALEHLGPVVVWLADTAVSFLVGLLVGLLAVGVVVLIRRVFASR